MTRNVLVVGINYAPEHTGIAPYTTQACDYLTNAGHNVVALTGVPHYPQWTVPADYRWSLRAEEQHGDVQLRRLRHFVPANQSAATRAIYEVTFGANVVRRADTVLVLNEGFARYVAGVGVADDKIKQMPNWSHVAAPEGDRDLTRQRLGWTDNEVVALHSGNMGFKQGLENVVAAARLASSEGSNVRFVLMGDGNQRRALEELAVGIPNLTFLPPADAEDFPNVLAAADVLLVNERASVLDMSLPSKLTSYFRAGMPVIAAVPGLGGTAREVARSGAGLVVEPEDAAALLSGIVELTNDDNLLQTFRLAAHAHAHESLGAEKSLRLLNEAICGPDQAQALARTA